MPLLATGGASAAPPRRDQAIEPKRLGRSLTLAWVRIGEGQYKVAGQDEPFYYVDLSLDVPCTCVDATIAGYLCKHALRCLTVERDPRVFEAVLAEYERQVRREREAAARPTAPRRARRTTQTEG